MKGELRAFVYQGKLTALSQYYTNCYFASIPEREEAIVASVTRFHETLLQLVPSTLPSYIIDLVVFEDAEKAKDVGSGVTLVELNPWSEKTGSALFSWSTEEDILLGKAPFEFRYLKNPPSVRVGASWQTLIEQARTVPTPSAPSTCTLS